MTFSELQKEFIKIYPILFSKSNGILTYQMMNEIEILTYSYLEQNLVGITGNIESSLKSNLKQFTKGKMATLVDEWNKVKDKNPDSFKSVMDKYNNLYLKTEDQVINRSIIQGERLQKLRERTKKIPIIEWVSVGDSKVRPEHQKLNGMKLPADDEFWTKHGMPGTSYRCRCSYKVHNDGVTKDISPSIKESVIKEKKDSGIAANPYTNGIIFTNENTYIKNSKK